MGILTNQRDSKLRTVIMHDPELDDQNTIIRYLLYANEFQTEGLIYSSSMFHWKGDGNGTLFTGESEHSRFGIGAIERWRWDDDVLLFEPAVDAYEKVYNNLKLHAEGYPEPDELRSKIMYGNVEFPGDISKDSAGSLHIRKLILDDIPGKLYLLTGAGHSTIGRALLSIEESFRGSDAWDAIYNKIVNKVIIQSFGDQDGIYGNYIVKQWPDIEFREMATMIWGYMARRVALPNDQVYLSASWTKEHITPIGPLGALYMVWGDGKQLHKNDIADFFGFKGLTANELAELGYIPWYGEPEEPESWISEGDTSMYMNLLDNGLDAHVEAGYGGWGGRNGKDIDLNGVASTDFASTRWFGAAQRDFATRMLWSVTPEYTMVNHPPRIEAIEFNSSMSDRADLKSTKVRPGQRVDLTFVASDPDGDRLSGKWWQYQEAGSYPGEIKFTESEPEKGSREFSYPFSVPSPEQKYVLTSRNEKLTMTCSFMVPTDAINGQTIHLIAEVKDNAKMPLTTYKRVVLTVER